MSDAEAENLDVQGFVSDIRSFEPARMYDVLLIDRTLHMLDASERPAFEVVLEADRRDWPTVLRRRGCLFAHQG